MAGLVSSIRDKVHRLWNKKMLIFIQANLKDKLSGCHIEETQEYNSLDSLSPLRNTSYIVSASG